MHAAPDPILGGDPPTPTKLVLIGVVLGFLLYHLLVPRQPVRVVRFAVMPPAGDVP